MINHKPSLCEQDSDPVDRIVINVGGIKFETHVATLQNIVDTRLAWLTENADPDTFKRDDFFFDRHPGAFVYILNFYRTGKLHIPKDMCGPAFEEELQFWGIDEKQMEPCCWEGFTKHREAEANLRSFEGPGFEDLHSVKERKASVMSVHAGNQRYNRYLDKAWKILDDPHSSKCAKMFSLLSCFMIILSVSGYCLSTMPIMHSHTELMLEINYICVVFFTIECVARLVTTPNRKDFLMDYKNWIDFISVAPSYLVLVVKNKWVKNLVIIRLLRVFKFFKLSYGLQVMLHTLKASSYELTLLLLILLIPLVIFSSLVYAVESNFVAEEKTKFTSIPVTFWWCLITMTTVGYGDITPLTWPGQIIGSVCAIFGLLIIALPISVIGGNFSLYYAHVRARLKLPRKNRKLLQGNMRGLLRHPLSLSLRDRDRKLKRNNQKAIRLKPEKSLSPSAARGYINRHGFFDSLSNQTNESNDTTLLVAGEHTAENIPRQRNSRRSALIQVTSSEDSLNTSTPQKIFQKESDMERVYDTNVDGESQSVDSINQLDGAATEQNDETDHTTPRKLHTLSNSNPSNGDLVMTESNNLSVSDILQPLVPRTSSQSSSWSSCSSPPEYHDLISDSTHFLVTPDFQEIMDEVDKGESHDNQNISDVTSTSNLTSLKQEQDESNIDDDILKIEKELNKNSERILWKNLNKLNTISKALDETIPYQKVDKEIDRSEVSNRRISMKLLTDCEQLMMSEPNPENGFLNENIDSSKRNVNNALAAATFMSYHPTRKKCHPSNSISSSHNEQDIKPETIIEETPQPEGLNSLHATKSINDHSGSEGTDNEHGSKDTIAHNGSKDRDNHNGNNNTNGHNDNKETIGSVNKTLLQNHKKLPLSGVYSSNEKRGSIGVYFTSAEHLTSSHINFNRRLSPTSKNYTSKTYLKVRVKSDSDLSDCDKHESMPRNRSELYIPHKSMGKESGV